MKEVIPQIAQKGKKVSRGNRICGPARHTYKHGLSNIRFYRIWRNMKSRIQDKNNDAYHLYGGRGIALDKEWEDFINFKNDMYESYIKHVAEYSEKNTSIDRIDNNKGYWKNNCRWATQAEQLRNTCRSIKVTLNGETMVFKDWCKKLGINYVTGINRIYKYGYSPANALLVGKRIHLWGKGRGVCKPISEKILYD